MRNEQLIEMGFCVKPHGIKGGFTFNLSNTDESILEKGMKVTLFPKDAKSSLSKDGEVFTLKSISFGNKVISYLEEVSDRNKVEEIIPFEIYADRDLFPGLEEDEFYLSDLIGMKVLVEGTEEEYGAVTDFYDNTAQIVLVVKGTGKQVLELPFIEEFFPEVNAEKNYLTMNIPDYIEGKK